MNKITRTLDNTAIFLLALCFLFFQAVVNFWPASYWLKVDFVKAVSVKQGERVPMLVDRTINRPFTGEWVVSVKRFVELGWVHHCHGTGKANYKPGGNLPTDLDLEWWTAGACKSLPAGSYIIETSWKIKPTFDFLPERQVSATSNIFEVTP